MEFNSLTAWLSAIMLAIVLFAIWGAIYYLLRRALLPQVFLSYRRGDVPTAVERIKDKLTGFPYFIRVFKDDHHVENGAHFPSVIGGILTGSDIVISLVGPGWEANGRIKENEDWVRRETELALTHRKLVTVLLDREHPPSTELLPDSLKEVFSFNAIRMKSTGKEFSFGFNQLLQEIRKSRYGSYGKYAIVTWWFVLSAMVVMPFQVYHGIIRVGVQSEADLRANQKLVQHDQSIESLSAQIKQAKFFPVLPDSLEQFVERLAAAKTPHGINRGNFWTETYRSKRVHWRFTLTREGGRWVHKCQTKIDARSVVIKLTLNDALSSPAVLEQLSDDKSQVISLVAFCNVEQVLIDSEQVVIRLNDCIAQQ